MSVLPFTRDDRQQRLNAGPQLVVDLPRPGSGLRAGLRLGDDLLATVAGPERGGVRQRLHELLLSELRAADLLDLSRAAVDSGHIRAMKGGPATGPSQVDRGKAGSNHHVIVETHGIPLATTPTGGNRNDVTQLIPLIQVVPPIRGKRGQPLRRPKHLYADRGYDHEAYRDEVRRFQITPHIAPARHRAWLWPWCIDGSWKERSRSALVPPPAHPLGDPR